MRTCPNCGHASILSSRETELVRILRETPDGMRSSDLTDRLGVRPGTVHKMFWNLRGKLGPNVVVKTGPGTYKFGGATL